MSRDDENPLDRYTRKHGHAYPFRTFDHDAPHQLRVEYHRGYVRLYHPQQGEFYITRNAWVRLLRASLPVVKYMDQQFSVVRATRRYLAQERKFNQELRAQKKQTQQKALSLARRKKRRRGR
jgi:hypothetical protein